MSGDPADKRKPSRTVRLLKSARLPMVSGKASAAVLFVCLALAAALIFPLTRWFEVPVWIGVEIILGVWWVAWAVALISLLYSGQRVSHDHVLAPPRNWFSAVFGGKSKDRS